MHLQLIKWTRTATIVATKSKRAWFSQGWGCGGICPTLANGVKIHVSSYLVLFQPLSLRKVAGGWGSYDLWEWGGRTVSPHPHSHSTHCWLHYGRKNLHALSNSGPHDFAVHLHTWTIFCLLVSRTGIFPGFSNWCSELRAVLFYPRFTILLWFSHAQCVSLWFIYVLVWSHSSSRTSNCLLVSRTTSWEPFCHYHPQFPVGSHFTLKNCVAAYAIPFPLASLPWMDCWFPPVGIVFGNYCKFAGESFWPW